MKNEFKVIVKKVNRKSYAQNLTSDKIKNITSNNGKLSGLSDSFGIAGTRIFALVDDISIGEPENIAIIRNGKIIEMLHGNVVFIALHRDGESYDSLTPKEIRFINEFIFNGKEVGFTMQDKFIRVPYLEY